MKGDDTLRWVDLQAQSLAACEGSITMTSNGAGQRIMFDDNDHPILMAHENVVLEQARALSSVAALHRVNAEQLVPRCAHDGYVWPCPTKQAITPTKGRTRG